MIAMALSCNPKLLIADEPTTAIDVTIQAQILTLIKNLQEEFGMALMMITHDLGVIAEVCDRVVVMYLGKSVEQGSIQTVYNDPLHPYTQALLESIPIISDNIEQDQQRRLTAITGTVPSPSGRPSGCYFQPRCPHAIAGTCEKAIPKLVEGKPSHCVRCFLHSEERDQED